MTRRDVKYRLWNQGRNQKNFRGGGVQILAVCVYKKFLCLRRTIQFWEGLNP